MYALLIDGVYLYYDYMGPGLGAHIFVLVARKLYLIDYCFDNNFKAVHQKMVKYVNKLLKQLVNF